MARYLGLHPRLSHLGLAAPEAGLRLPELHRAQRPFARAENRSGDSPGCGAAKAGVRGAQTNLRPARPESPHDDDANDTVPALQAGGSCETVYLGLRSRSRSSPGCRLWDVQPRASIRGLTGRANGVISGITSDVGRKADGTARVLAAEGCRRSGSLTYLEKRKAETGT